MAKKKRRAPTEARLDLENIRKLKRLTKRVHKGLEEMERWILKMERGASARQGVPSEEEREAVDRLYAPLGGEGDEE